MNGSTSIATVNAAEGWKNYNRRTDTAPPSTTLTAEEHHLFSNPLNLFGDTLLNLADRRSTRDIAQYTNAIANKLVISRDALNARITKGLKDRARATGVTVDQVKDDLYHTRKANGIRSARKKPLQTLINTGETTDDEAEVDSTPPDDAHLFASPDHLVGETLLHAAERYSNRSLSRRLGDIPGTTTPIITASGIHARLTRAFNARSKQTCTPVDQLRTELARARASNGVRIAFTCRHPGLMEAVSRQVGQMVPQTRSGLAVSSPLAAATAEGEQREHTGETTGEDEDYASTTDVESLGHRNRCRASDIDVAGDVPISEIDPEMLEAAHILLSIRYSVVTSPAQVTTETGPRV